MGPDAADRLDPDGATAPAVDQEIGDEEIGDEELTALALAADPDGPVDPDAVPFRTEQAGPALLPAWYMAAPMAHAHGRARRLVLAGFIGALLVVNGAGLCVTYGFPEIAW